ncbi:hypothetical protein TNCV_4462561 [Trichonephila clavipes]|nr:hypothetical protein TNCV_4462561 [Trichonephila clavipes]
MWLKQNHQLRWKITFFVVILAISGGILSVSRTRTTITRDPEVHHVSVQFSGDRLDNQVLCLCELDSIGTKDTQIKRKTVLEKEIMTKFSKAYQTEDNRRVVSLPWKRTAQQ